MRILKQAAVVALGALVATVMVVLGLWQLHVYQLQGQRTAAARAAEPAIVLSTVARAGDGVGDAYGRTVTARGHYDPALQVVVDDPDDGRPARVLSGLVQADGTVVPVIRGSIGVGSDDGVALAPPSGTRQVSGVFLPSEPAGDRTTTAAGGETLRSVQLAVLAQQWRPALVPGFVTVNAQESVADDLAPAEAALPEASGRLRNAAYALQWWLFAAFALAMAGKMAYDLGRVDDSGATLRGAEVVDGPNRTEI